MKKTDSNYQTDLAPLCKGSCLQRRLRDCKKLLSILLSLCMLLSITAGLNLTAYAETSGDYTYKILDDGTAEITKYTGSATNVTIPSTIDGYTVTSIGDCAFFYCTSLTNITIPDSVAIIYDSAFEGCTSLASITLPDSVISIGYHAFYNTAYYNASSNWDNNALYIGNHLIKVEDSITGSYIIKYGTKTIADSAFRNCSNLRSVTIPDSVTSIGKSAFRGCINLVSITIPDSVTSIGYEAFYNCKSLTSITLPNSVTSIGICSFSNCISLTSVTIPDSVASIGENAFSGTAYYDDSSNWDNGVLYISNHLIEVKGSIGGSYIVKSGTKTIADSAFRNCSNLRSVTIPDSVTSIGDYAFYYCTSLTSVTIPDSVTSIGDYAFYNCYSLTSITIPNSVTSVGSSAFYNCNSLGAVNITDISSWCNISFDDNDSNPLHYAENLYINDELVTDLVIPNSVTEIKDYAFDYCSSLTSVTIPYSVISIGYEAFNFCRNLKSVKMPNNLMFIGDSAFSVCDSLTSITIPYKVTRIGNDVFRGCFSLTSIAIPDSVTSIGDYAFYYCYRLKNIYYKGSDKQWDNISIGKENNYLKSATIHYNYIQKCDIHTVITDEAIAPTCTSTGLTEGSHCSVCGEVIVAQTVVDETGHKSDGGVVTKSATCTAAGKKTYTCTVCGATKTETIKAKGHIAVTDKAVAATYAKAGKTEGSHCKTCGKVIVAQKTVAKLTVPKITLSSVKSSKSKQITVAWKKNTKVSGYQIQYSTSSKFTNAKTVTVSNNSTTSKTISKLTGNKKYYVRIRAYKTENGKKYYSAWSASKSVTTKK